MRRRPTTRRTPRRYLVLGCGGLLLLALVCSAVQSAGRAVGLLPTATPRPPTATPGPTNTPAPSRTPEPSRTPRPSATVGPTRTSAPTATPDIALTVTAEARRARAAEPCEPGQVKGNRNSLIYHTEGGRFYDDTRENVACFNSIADAEAAGYRASER